MQALYAAHVVGTWTLVPLCMLGSRCLQNAALVVMANWAASHLLVLGLGDFAPWAGYFVIDGASAAALSWWMTRAETLLDQCGLAGMAMLYAFQCAAHVEFALIPVDPQAYWLVLVSIALAQLVVLAGWLCVQIVRREAH